jgi:hypothetical protein
MMTATEMEDLLKNLDLRASTIEQILPTLATKEDLKAFATKEDLKAFATKEDLKAFATKEDLQAFPTRGEMDAKFEEAKRHATVLFESLRDDIRLLAEHVADILQRLPPRR